MNRSLACRSPIDVSCIDHVLLSCVRKLSDEVYILPSRGSTVARVSNSNPTPVYQCCFVPPFLHTAHFFSRK